MNQCLNDSKSVCFRPSPAWRHNSLGLGRKGRRSVAFRFKGKTLFPKESVSGSRSRLPVFRSPPPSVEGCQIGGGFRSCPEVLRPCAVRSAGLRRLRQRVVSPLCVGGLGWLRVAPRMYVSYQMQGRFASLFNKNFGPLKRVLLRFPQEAPRISGRHPQRGAASKPLCGNPRAMIYACPLNSFANLIASRSMNSSSPPALQLPARVCFRP